MFTSPSDTRSECSASSVSSFQRLWLRVFVHFDQLLLRHLGHSRVRSFNSHILLNPPYYRSASFTARHPGPSSKMFRLLRFFYFFRKMTLQHLAVVIWPFIIIVSSFCNKIYHGRLFQLVSSVVVYDAKATAFTSRLSGVVRREPCRLFSWSLRLGNSSMSLTFFNLKVILLECKLPQLCHSMAKLFNRNFLTDAYSRMHNAMSRTHMVLAPTTRHPHTSYTSIKLI